MLLDAQSAAYWLEMPEWTSAEAAILADGKNPAGVEAEREREQERQQRVFGRVSVSPGRRAEHERLREIAYHVARVNGDAKLETPAKWLAGFAKAGIPFSELLREGAGKPKASRPEKLRLKKLRKPGEVVAGAPTE